MLEDRMRDVAEEHGFPFETSDDGKTYIVECTFEDGRSQVVSGTSLMARERPTHVLFSFVGDYTGDIDLEELVRRHMGWRKAKVGILDQDLVVCATLDPIRVEDDDGGGLVKDALEEVSILADELEQELFGADEN